MGKGATSEVGKYLFRTANVWVDVCAVFCVRVCGDSCYVAAVVKDSVVLSLGVLMYVVCLCKE